MDLQLSDLPGIQRVKTVLDVCLTFSYLTRMVYFSIWHCISSFYLCNIDWIWLNFYRTINCLQLTIDVIFDFILFNWLKSISSRQWLSLSSIYTGCEAKVVDYVIYEK